MQPCKRKVSFLIPGIPFFLSCTPASILLFPATPANAQPVEAIANGDWNAAGTWSNNAAPAAANSYQIGSGFTVFSTPITGASTVTRTFSGGTLAVAAGGTLELRSTSTGGSALATYVTPVIGLASGSTLLLSSSVGNITRTITSGLQLDNSGEVQLRFTGNGYTNSLILSDTASLSGGANFVLDIDAASVNGERKYLNVQSANNAYSGNWAVTSRNYFRNVRQGMLIASAPNALGTGMVVLTGSILDGRVDGALNSLRGVEVGVDSTVRVGGIWENPAASVALTASGSDMAITASSVSIGNLAGVRGSSISAAEDTPTSLRLNTTADSHFAGVISGNIALTKTGNATTILSGNNIYTGGTTIEAGTLQLGNGDLTGSVAGEIVNHGTLAFQRLDDIVLENPLSGPGTLIQRGPGTLSVNDVRELAGPTVVQGGTLAVNGSLSSPTTVEAGGTLAGTGTLVGNVLSRGLIWPGDAATRQTTRGALTIQGDFTGDNGLLRINSVLRGDDSPSSRLILDGGAATGHTGVVVVNIGGDGGLTTANGIRVIEARNGATTAPTAFALDSRVVAGAYEYLLLRGDRGGSDPESWYLRSVQEPSPPFPPSPDPTPRPLFRPEVAAYLANQRLASQFLVHSLHDRETSLNNTGAPARSTASPAFAPRGWARVTGRWEHSESRNNVFGVNTDAYTVQGGTDLVDFIPTISSARMRGGVMAGYGWASSTASAAGNTAKARGNVEGVNIGTYLTWFQDDASRLGAYFDTWFQYGWYDNSVKGDRLPTVDYHAQNLGVSAEAGYALPVYRDWIVQPQAQAIYINYREGDINEPNGTRVRGANANGVITRLGARLYRDLLREAGPRIRPYAAVNWWYTSTDSSITFNQLPVGDLYPRNRFETKLGVEATLGPNWAAWASLSGMWGEQRYSQYGVRLGMRYAW